MHIRLNEIDIATLMSQRICGVEKTGQGNADVGWVCLHRIFQIGKDIQIARNSDTKLAFPGQTDNLTEVLVKSGLTPVIKVDEDFFTWMLRGNFFENSSVF